MPYCHVPWTNIDISPQGDISPCCKFEHRVYKNKVVNITDSSIDEYLNSLTLKEVKNDFENDLWPKGCVRCKIEEESNVESRRVQETNRWEKYLDNHQNIGFLTASISFGNTCNLSCITCEPYSSSKWYQEYLRLYGRSFKPNHFYKKGFVEDFYKQTPNLVHLDVPGGEPLLSGVDEQKELFKLFIKDNKAENITLHYTTNGTKFPDSSLTDLWNHFKGVEVQLSIDGVGERYEYIRYPASWEDFSNNLEKYKQLAKIQTNLKLNISSTVSAFSVAYLDELLDWAVANEFHHPYLGLVYNPRYMRPTVWPQKAKEFILERLTQSKHNVEPFILLMKNEDDSENFDFFKHMVPRHDQYRKLSFKKTFPEMFTFFSH